jgi:hypothetical protein
MKKRNVKFPTLTTTICLLILGWCLAPATSWAQAIVEKDFSCTATPFGVNVDFSGLGRTNLCVTGNATVDLSCACAGGGGNCTSDSKKAGGATALSGSQTFQPKNGRIITTFFLTPAPSDADCTGPDVGLQCGSGQNAKLIKWTTEDNEPTFSVCTTTAAPGTPCTCDPTTDLDTISCGPESATPFPGKHNSCSSLF